MRCERRARAFARGSITGNDVVAIRRKINGGAHGLEEARVYLKKGEKIWPDSSVVQHAVSKDAAGTAGSQVEYVQRHLRELGYYEVGEVDGEFGSRARGALLAFKADNGLPLTPEIDKDTILALYNGKPRVVGENRAKATAADLAPKSRTVWMAVRNKVASMASAIVSFAIAAFYGLVEEFEEAQRVTEPFRAALSHIHPAVWFGLAGVIALVIWRMNANVEQRVVEDYRKGKKL